MGLGSLSAISLQEARTRSADCCKRRHDGIDPIEARRIAREQAVLGSGKAITFKEATNKYIGGHRAGWRNAKHAGQWESTLATYAHPIIGALSVQAIDTALVLKVLEPIWATKPKTASRLRGRIESVLDWGKVRGYRRGENPARWRGHLDKLLPARSKVRRVVHHAALAYAEMPDFMGSLRQQDGTAARALEFTILTAARTGRDHRRAVGRDQFGGEGVGRPGRAHEGWSGAPRPVKPTRDCHPPRNAACCRRD
jgi:hypothetical protein